MKIDLTEFDAVGLTRTFAVRRGAERLREKHAAKIFRDLFRWVARGCLRLVSHGARLNAAYRVRNELF